MPPNSTKKPLESTLVKKVKDDLKKAGCIYVRKNQAASIRGIPDVEACFYGWYVALECKRDKNARREPLQLFTLDRIQLAGGFARIVYPENWDEVLSEIIRLPKRT